MRCRKSDQPIVPEKPVKADGGKGLAQNRFGQAMNQAYRRDEQIGKRIARNKVQHRESRPVCLY